VKGWVMLYHEVAIAYSISMYGDKMTIGTRKEDKPGPNSYSGTAEVYIYHSNTDSWKSNVIISSGSWQSYFGHATACGDLYEIISANSASIPASPDLTYIQVTKSIDGRHNPYVHITDPLANNDDNTVNDVETSGRYFIIGLPYGESYNGQNGGRIFIGQIR
jgi:hypothetical protein